MDNRRSYQTRSEPSCVLATELLRPHDVLFGRGTGPNENQGNVRFRGLLENHRNAYYASPSAKNKSDVVWQITREVKKNGGRFLEKVGSVKQQHRGGVSYREVDDSKAFLKTRGAFRYALKRSSDPPPTSQREQNPFPRDLASSERKNKVFDPTDMSHNIQTDHGLEPSQWRRAPQDPHLNLHGRPANGDLAKEGVAALWQHAPTSLPSAPSSFMNNVPIHSITWRSPSLTECRIVTPQSRELLTRILTERSYLIQVGSLEFPGTQHSPFANSILDTMSTRMTVQQLLQTQGPFGVYPPRVRHPTSDIIDPRAGVTHPQRL